MYAQAERAKENTIRAFADTVAQKRQNIPQGSGFVDHRQILKKNHPLGLLRPLTMGFGDSQYREHQPKNIASPKVLQPKLVVNHLGYLKKKLLIEQMESDPDIGWDKRWGVFIDALMQQDQVFTFDSLKDLEIFLMNGLFPMANIDQPTSLDDQVKGRLCFVYAALAAKEISTGTPVTQGDEEALVGKNRYSAGGGASTAFRQMGMSPRELVVYDTDDKGVPTNIKKENVVFAKRMVIDGMQQNRPLTAGVRWSRNRRSGNHWVYIVGLSGDKLHIRDQQNGHVLGTIDMNSWEGEAIDKSFQYVVTKVVDAQSRS